MGFVGAAIAERLRTRLPSLLIVGAIVVTIAAAGLSRHVFAQEKSPPRIVLGQPSEPANASKMNDAPNIELPSARFGEIERSPKSPLGLKGPVATSSGVEKRPAPVSPNESIGIVTYEPVTLTFPPPSPLPLLPTPQSLGFPPTPPEFVGSHEVTTKLLPAVSDRPPQPSWPEIVPAAVRPETSSGVDVVVPASAQSCPHCGRHGALPPGDPLAPGRCVGCGHGDCVPGRRPCHPCESKTVLGAFFCDLYECLCCPDPCYEPKWIPLADAAFFADGVRPVSQTRFTWDSAHNFQFPDRSEFFWPRADGGGKGPKPIAPFKGEKGLKYNQLTMYTETAIGGFSTFTSIPYLAMDPILASHAAGFGDMTVGTKSLLFDCELLQISFQFRTYIPIGNFFKGLGTGHTTLEPSLLYALKLSQDTYLQGQLSEWIPLGGDPGYSGSVFYSHTSLNHVLCRITPDVPIIATFEVNTWSFQDGAYTDPTLGAFQKSSGETYVSLGPGLRLFVCDRVDFGVGSAFAVTRHHFAQTVVSSVFRVRF
ncbi:MAG: transporter [Planctomycetes bacterium]|nr:transporter [Planctomycetota bacterium]